MLNAQCVGNKNMQFKVVFVLFLICHDEIYNKKK